MFWAIVVLVALLVPIVAIIADSRPGRARAGAPLTAGVDDRRLVELAERVERLEDEVESLARALEAAREEVQGLQGLLESSEVQRLTPS